MTDFAVMLEWFAPETVTLYCDECGREMQSVDGRHRKVLCQDCKAERIRRHMNARNRDRGITRYTFDDPCVDLAYAVINQALNDRDWQRKHNPDGQALDLVDCGAREFIEDGGVELWLGVLGLNIRPSMSRAIREGTE